LSDAKDGDTHAFQPEEKTMTKTMTDEEYVARYRCPTCGSEDIHLTAFVPEFGGDFITLPVQCEACGRHWKNVYSLIGYEPA